MSPAARSLAAITPPPAPLDLGGLVARHQQSLWRYLRVRLESCTSKCTSKVADLQPLTVVWSLAQLDLRWIPDSRREACEARSPCGERDGDGAGGCHTTLAAC